MPNNSVCEVGYVSPVVRQYTKGTKYTTTSFNYIQGTLINVKEASYLTMNTVNGSCGMVGLKGSTVTRITFSIGTAIDISNYDYILNVNEGGSNNTYIAFTVT